jgi:hypothetical protein
MPIQVAIIRWADIKTPANHANRDQFRFICSHPQTLKLATSQYAKPSPDAPKNLVPVSGKHIYFRKPDFNAN